MTTYSAVARDLGTGKPSSTSPSMCISIAPVHILFYLLTSFACRHATRQIGTVCRIVRPGLLDDYQKAMHTTPSVLIILMTSRTFSNPLSERQPASGGTPRVTLVRL